MQGLVLQCSGLLCVFRASSKSPAHSHSPRSTDFAGLGDSRWPANNDCSTVPPPDPWLPSQQQDWATQGDELRTTLAPQCTGLFCMCGIFILVWAPQCTVLFCMCWILILVWASAAKCCTVARKSWHYCRINSCRKEQRPAVPGKWWLNAARNMVSCPAAEHHCPWRRRGRFAVNKKMRKKKITRDVWWVQVCIPKLRYSTPQRTSCHCWSPTTCFSVTNHSKAALLWLVRQK